MNKKLKVILIIAVLAVLAAGFYVYMDRNSRKVEIKTAVVDPSKIPDGLPTDLPVEAGSQVLENSQLTANDGRNEYVRVSTTLKSPEEVVKSYRQFFVSKGWKEVQTQNHSENVVSSLLKNDENTVLISGKTNTTLKQTTVSITLTTSKKSK